MSNDSPQKSGLFKGCLLGFFGAVVVMVLIGAVIAIVAAAMFANSDHSLTQHNIHQTVLSGNSLKSNETIAVVRVVGTITSDGTGADSTSCYDFADIIDHLLNDPRDLKALIVRIDSPGGELTASDVIYNAIDRVKQRDIPVIVLMESMAASGGYYIACHADHIVAHPNTLTGSIGVIISGLNVSEGMDKLGIKSQVFTSGDFKDMLSPLREMRADEAAYIQNMVNESFNGFVKLVSEGRNISPGELRARQAIDGRIISGRDALEMGLVDSLGYWRDAVDAAVEQSGATDACIILYERKPTFADLLMDMGLESRRPNRVSVELGHSPCPKLKPGLPYLLPTMYATGSLVTE